MEFAMDSKSQFYALEVMCRERARLADRESNYWLAEAEEWARLRQSCISGRLAQASHQDLRKTENEQLSALSLLGECFL
jgi:hypothetical protein